MVEYSPLISVLIASYNHQDYIEEALQSIWQQDYPHVEIIVVDDCSPDNSWALLQRLVGKSPLPMKIAQNEKNLGPSGTFNAALAMAQGDLVAFVASDDVFTEQRFSGSITQFSKNSQLQVAYANGRTIDNGNVGELIHRKKALDLLARSPADISHYLYTNSSPLFIQAALFKKQLLDDIGGFETDMLADDWLLNSRIFSSFKHADQYVYIDDEVIYYRQHDGNVHKNYERHEKLKLEFIEKHTPDDLKAEGFSNIYCWAARQRLKQGCFELSWDYYLRGQKYHFHLSRIRFVFSWLSRRLKSIG